MRPLPSDRPAPLVPAQREVFRRKHACRSVMRAPPREQRLSPPPPISKSKPTSGSKRKTPYPASPISRDAANGPCEGIGEGSSRNVNGSQAGRASRSGQQRGLDLTWCPGNPVGCRVAWATNFQSILRADPFESYAFALLPSRDAAIGPCEGCPASLTMHATPGTAAGRHSARPTAVDGKPRCGTRAEARLDHRG
jgi:hypothetical protein